jgi:hypothetical protein
VVDSADLNTCRFNQQETGGNLVELIEKLGAYSHGLNFKLKIRALSADAVYQPLSRDPSHIYVFVLL